MLHFLYDPLHHPQHLIPMKQHDFVVMADRYSRSVPAQLDYATVGVYRYVIQGLRGEIEHRMGLPKSSIMVPEDGIIKTFENRD